MDMISDPWRIIGKCRNEPQENGIWQANSNYGLTASGIAVMMPKDRWNKFRGRPEVRLQPDLAWRVLRKSRSVGGRWSCQPPAEPACWE
ncbi:MAG TPA: hypothetical protein DET40_15315 [Lentisphaeria bacterium]|nr:hypothetical protein [Lentisphaeria bacterium]